jgi:hypothetical protein
MAWVACPIEHGDDAAHRVAENDRIHDADGVAESPDVICALLEGPVCRVLPCRSSMIAQVEIDITCASSVNVEKWDLKYEWS